MIMLELIARIFFAHAIADYALQNNRLNRWKNVNEAIPVIEKPTWVFALTAHAMTNGAVLYLMTGNITLGIVETILHWFIDLFRCNEIYSFHVDQALHLITKIVYIVLLILGVIT